MSITGTLNIDGIDYHFTAQPDAVTLNPADKNPWAVLSNGNLSLTGPASAATYGQVRATIGRSAGKHAFAMIGAPIVIPSDDDFVVGLADAAFDLASGDLGGNSSGPFNAALTDAGQVRANGANGTTTAPWAAGDNIYVLVDCDAGEGRFQINDTVTSVAFTFTPGTLVYPAAGVYYDTNTATFQFAGTFPNTLPAGYEGGW